MERSTWCCKRSWLSDAWSRGRCRSGGSPCTGVWQVTITRAICSAGADLGSRHCRARTGSSHHPVFTGEAQLSSGNWVRRRKGRRRRMRPSTGASGESWHWERLGCCGRRPRHGLTWDYLRFSHRNLQAARLRSPAPFPAAPTWTTSVSTMLASVTRPHPFFQGLGSVPIGVCAGCGCSVMRSSEVPGLVALLLPFCVQLRGPQCCAQLSSGTETGPRSPAWFLSGPLGPDAGPVVGRRGRGQWTGRWQGCWADLPIQGRVCT